MWNPFRSNDSEEQHTTEQSEPVEEEVSEPEQTEEPEEPEEDTMPEPPTVPMEKNETVTFEYTEHEAEVGFTTGDVRTFVFDKMHEKADAYVLSNYNDGLRTGCGNRREVGPNGSKKVATIQKENMTFFDTVERTSKEMSEDVHEEWEAVPLPVAKWYHQNEENHEADFSDVDDETFEAWDAQRYWP